MYKEILSRFSLVIVYCSFFHNLLPLNCLPSEYKIKVNDYSLPILYRMGIELGLLH